MSLRRWWGALAVSIAAALVSGVVPSGFGASQPAASVAVDSPPAELAVEPPPNVFFYNLDDLRDALPGQVDPLQFMPKSGSGWPAGRVTPRTSSASPRAARPGPH